MSVELIVLSERRLNSMADWQHAIDAEQLHIALPTGISIDGLDGFLAVRSNGTMTGFECDYCDVQEILSQYPSATFGRSWPDGLIFRWGGDFDACLAAYASAAAYAKASGGVLFDPQEGSLMSWGEALAQIDHMRQEFKKWSALPRIMAERIGGES